MSGTVHSKKIIIEANDKELLNATTNFVRDIEKEFVKFNKKLALSEEKWKDIKSKDFIFTPEEISKKSPLTIINALWGTGKTYFVESMMKHFIKGNIKSEVFKRCYIIDAWKFSNSENVSIEFAVELSKHLLESSEKLKNAEKKDLFKKIVSSIVPSSISISIPTPIGVIDMSKDLELKGDDAKKVDKTWKHIKNNSEPTIIIIDNIERLGKHSWDLLKTLLRLQEFNNFLLILTTNLKGFNGDDVTSGEYPIEKYVDFYRYDMQQGYTKFLSSIFDDNRIVSELNSIFINPGKNNKMSIRELQSFCNMIELSECKTSLCAFRKIYPIWDDKSQMLRIVNSYIGEMIEIEKKKRNLVRRLSGELLKTTEMGNAWRSQRVFVSLGGKLFSNNVVDLDRNEAMGYIFNHDYTQDFIKWKRHLSNIRKEYVDELEKLENVYYTNHSEYEKQRKIIDALSSKSKKLTQLKNAYRITDEESIELEAVNAMLLQANKKFQIIATDINQLGVDIKNMRTKRDSVFSDIEKYIDELEIIGSTTYLNENDRKSVVDLLMRKFDDIHAEFLNSSFTDYVKMNIAQELLISIM